MTNARTLPRVDAEPVARDTPMSRGAGEASANAPRFRPASRMLQPATSATLRATSFSRSATNRRRLQVRVDLEHRATIDVTVSRMDTSLGERSSGSVAAGSRTVVIPIARTAPSGEAMMTVIVTEDGGRIQSFRRLIAVPARIHT